MKKLIYSAAVLALAFFAGSCQRENLEPVAANGTVTYTVQVPGAIATKADDDGVNNVDKLVYEVYRTAGEKVTAFSDADNCLYHRVAEVKDGKAEIALEFVNDQNFTVLFWAYDSSTDVYDVDDLTNVTIASTAAANTHETAAFTGVDFVVNCVSEKGGNVKLTRPVAQLNIATTPESLKMDDTVITVNESYVKVYGLSTSFNVAKQEAGVATGDVTYTQAAVLGGTVKVGSKEYRNLAMNYLGFIPTEGASVKVDYLLKTSEGDIDNTISNVPVKPNYKTNIIGNLISATDNYNVTLGPWGTPDTNVEVVAVSTAQDLQEAIDNIQAGAEGNIKLEGDINLNDLVGLLSTKAAPAYGLLIPETKTVVLDLGGYTLTGNAIVDGSKVHVIVNNGTLTIMNGTLTANGTNGGSAISNNGTLTITDATVNGASSDTATGGYASYAVNSQGTESKLVVNNSTINGRGVIGATEGTKVEINGGTYHTPAVAWGHAVYADGEGTEVVINDGTFSEGYEYSANNWGMYQIYSANKAKVTVNGGTFMPWDCANGYDLCTATEGTIVIYGGSFAEDPSNQNGINYVAEGYGVVANENGTFTVEKLPTAAKIGDTEYLKLAEAVNNVKEGETITILEGTIEEGTIKLPAALKNVRFLGEEGAILKDMTIMAHDGNSISYEGLTFEGLTFENSRISITGWRTNGAVVKNFTVTNCIFRNLDDNTNSAPVHINMAATEPVNGFIFTNNVIDGATGGSKSGIYAQVTGEVLVSGNIINNVAFRPYVIQVTTDDNIADNFVVTNNTFSGSAAGRAQGLGNNAEGTDAVNIVVTENIFKGITDAQQICYWNFNDATTEFDLSGNYYDIDILANPSRIYYNGAASGLADLIAKNIFPIYTELNADGTINKDSSYTPSTVAKIGDVEYYSLQEALNAGGEITLLRNVTVDETVVLAEGTTVVLDLNGKTLAAADKNVVKNNGGNLTIKNGTITRTGDVVGYSVNNESGEIAVVNATIQRGLYTSGSKLTATNANISHEQSSRHAIYAWDCEVIINSGTFHNDNAGNATLMASGSSVVTINGGTFSIADGRSSLGWTSSMIDQNSTSQVIVKGGLFNGGFRINSADTKLTIEGGEFNTNNGSAFTDYSGTKVVKGGKFTDTGAQNWAKKYIAEGYEMNANGEVVAK